MFKNHNDGKKPNTATTPHLETLSKSNQESLMSLKVSSNPKYETKKNNSIFNNSFKSKPKAVDQNLTHTLKPQNESDSRHS